MTSPARRATRAEGATGPARESSIPARRLYWSAGVVIGASLPHWLTLPPWMPALLLACVAWRIAAQRRRWRAPGRAVRTALAALALAVVLAEYRTVNGVEAGSALLVVMVALKLVEARTHRDELVLIIIAYFLVFASLLVHQSIFVGAYLLLFVLVTTVGLLQLGRRGPLLPVAGSARLAARMLLQALPIMVLLFVLFPRLSGPLWALPSDPVGQATSGLDDRMSPGDITALGLSDEVAFRVEFDGPPPPTEERYWRGPVLTRTDGRAWSRPFGMRVGGTSSIEYLGEPAEYRVMLEPNRFGFAFALDMPRQWSAPTRLTMTDDYQLVVRSARRAQTRLDYRVTSHTRYRTLEPLNPVDRSALTRIPEAVNPRTRALAAGWLARGLEPEAVVAAALSVFRDEPFYYTLTPPPLASEHAVDEFVFGTRQGFCEHYASAFAFMMRAAGVPARVVTGYHGGELNGVGRYYIVRQSNAHAWAEVWLDGRGWVRVDPTAAVAPERIELGSAALALDGAGAGSAFRFGWITTARYAWDALNTYWYGWVVGYTQSTQRTLLEGLGFVEATLAGLAGAAAAGVALILAGLTAYHALRARPRSRTDPAARCFARFCRRLAKLRVPPPAPHEPPSAYAERAAAALPAAAPAIHAIAAAYVGARYEPDPHGAALATLRRLVSAFRRYRTSLTC